MSDGEDVSAREFGASFKGFLDKMAREVPEKESPFRARLKAHFGCDPSTLPIVSESFEKQDHQNVHIAVDAYANADGRRSELLGVAVQHDYFGVHLAQLIASGDGNLVGGTRGAAIGPVQQGGELTKSLLGFAAPAAD